MTRVFRFVLRDSEKRLASVRNATLRVSRVFSPQHLQHGEFPAAPGPENKIDIAVQACVDNGLEFRLNDKVVAGTAEERRENT